MTKREWEILKLIADALTSRQMAERPYLTPDTVKRYNQQIYQKLGGAHTDFLRVGERVYQRRVDTEATTTRDRSPLVVLFIAGPTKSIVVFAQLNFQQRGTCTARWSDGN